MCVKLWPHHLIQITHKRTLKLFKFGNKEWKINEIWSSLKLFSALEKITKYLANFEPNEAIKMSKYLTYQTRKQIQG